MPRYTYVILSILFLAIFPSFSHTQHPNLERGEALLLASYTDPNNDIAVSVHLRRGKDDAFSLEAEFVPPAGTHLYSKDLPQGSDDLQGLPTLLEVPSASKMQPAGMLAESVSSGIDGYELDSPLVYPEGPVSLTLPIKLPLVSGWVKDNISLTYMACTTTYCKIPTVGKLVQVMIPGALSFSP